jgi:hypothetical protein
MSSSRSGCTACATSSQLEIMRLTSELGHLGTGHVVQVKTRTGQWLRDGGSSAPGPRKRRRRLAPGATSRSTVDAHSTNSGIPSCQRPVGRVQEDVLGEAQRHDRFTVCALLSQPVPHALQLAMRIFGFSPCSCIGGGPPGHGHVSNMSGQQHAVRLAPSTSVTPDPMPPRPRCACQPHRPPSPGTNRATCRRE